MTAVRVHISTFEYKDPRFGWYELFADPTDLGSSDVEAYASHNAIFFADNYIHPNLNAGETWNYWVRAVFDNGDTPGDLRYLGAITLASSGTGSGGVDDDVPAFSATVTASEAIAAGALINLFTSGGALRMRNANATDATKPADGFVLAAVGNGAAGTIYSAGQANTSLSGLTPGAVYYLDIVAGVINTVVPSASGNIIQQVGKALSATSLLFNPEVATRQI